MQKGYNSDVSYKGLTYHIQTEDWGLKNPFFVSQIFCNGAVIKNIKIPYTKVLPAQAKWSDDTIRIALETQHESVLDLLLSGQLI
jgi:hypothetical protein